MTTETRERIKAYKKALPDLRERVIAVALLLAMSVAMLASASFAWITLSTAPEATGMQTTVAANGNLEIALAQGSTQSAAVAPLESLVGDSSASEGQTIVGANVTWGNLVNVSDPSYGLSEISLRPAMLSDYNLTTYPLYGAAYGGDGRVVATSDKYEFASWKDFGDGTTRFVAGADAMYGVRAIASTTAENVTGNLTLAQYSRDVEDAYRRATSVYTGMITNDKSAATKLSSGSTCISAPEALVTVFAQDKVNEILGSGTNTSCSAHLYDFYEMLLLLESALEAEADALLTMANWQAYKANGGTNTNTFETIEDLRGISAAKLKSDYGVTLDSLTNTTSNFFTDWDNLQKAIQDIEPKAMECKNPNDVNNPTYYFSDISTAVSYLVDINSTTMDGTELSKISSNISAVLGGGTKMIVVNKGILYNFEKRAINNSDRMYANVSVKVKYIISYTVKGIVQTKARNNGDPTKIADMEECMKSTESSSTMSARATRAGGEVVAKDTYGMALDIWVRTNYPEAVLTLEGSAIYEYPQATGVDAQGNTVNLYILVTDDAEYDIYQKDDIWYYAADHT